MSNKDEFDIINELNESETKTNKKKFWVGLLSFVLALITVLIISVK